MTSARQQTRSLKIRPCTSGPTVKNSRIKMTRIPMSDEEDSLFYREYLELPESVRQYYSFNEYKWMTPEQRANILADNTEPDDYED